jgi:hypothetical protein
MPTTNYSHTTRIKKLAGMTISKFHTLNPSLPQGGRYNFEQSSAILGTIGYVYRKESYLKNYVSEYIPPQSELIYSLNNTTEDGFTVGNTVQKDMYNNDYTSQFNPDSYPDFFQNMTPFEDNIVVGDKDPLDMHNASYWDDLGDDIFDNWGYFYLYDVESGKYYFPVINPQNQDNGVMTTQIFIAFGSVFTIIHGWSVQGIFKFDISVNNNKPFRFGAYGDMGSDEDGNIEYLTQPYSLGSNNLTLFYFKNQEGSDDTEILYAYFIPKKIEQNSSVTYVHNYDGQIMSLKSNEITQGLLVYFSKTNDVKDWVIHDLGI